mgnify:CR=1|jgi:hypothetical protein
MRVLILRTFAHTFIWEYSINHCKYYKTQLLNILDWEPDYKHFKTKEFSCALGIYMDMYFSYETRHTNTIVYQGTDNEQIISILKLNSFSNSSSFINCDKNLGDVEVYYKYLDKLWKKPNRSMMKEIDQSLITEKMKDVENIKGAVSLPPSGYFPLSFSLDEKVVKKVLGKFSIDMKEALDRT